MSAPICKVCRAAVGELCTVDFNYATSTGDRLPLGRSGEPVTYFKCVDCSFVFTDFCDTWDAAEFSARIYNDDYAIVDADYAGRRPRANAKATASNLAGIVRHDARLLDYGGGSGLLSEELRKAGYAAATSWDPFTSDHAISGVFDVITCYEVVEHCASPDAVFADLARLLSETGVVFMSTNLVPANIAQLRENWWYLGTRNGHLSLYSHDSLQIMCARHGLRCWSDGTGFHILSKASQLPGNNPVLRALAAKTGWLNGAQRSQLGFYNYLRGAFAEGRPYYMRQLETAVRAWPFIGRGVRVLEVGGISAVTRYLRGEVSMRSCEADLSDAMAPANALPDVILCLESRYRAPEAATAFHCDDLGGLFKTSFAALPPGGVLLLTTPNACSVSSIARLVQFQHPYAAPSRTCEHAPGDVKAAAQAAGFREEASSTFFSHPPQSGVDREKLAQAIAYLGGNPADRGDTMFFALRKPA